MTDIYTQLFEAQRKIGHSLTADATGQAGPARFQYLALPGLLEIVRPVFEELGLLLTFSQGTDHVAAEVRHVETGSSVTVTAAVYSHEDPKKAGAAFTYGKRYALGALLAIGVEEEDGTGQPGRSMGRPSGNGTGPADGPPPEGRKGAPPCPKCNGPMWDNRDNKRNPKAPDFKCRDDDCKDDRGYTTALWENS